jgi:hypothetical protein
VALSAHRGLPARETYGRRSGGVVPERVSRVKGGPHRISRSVLYRWLHSCLAKAVCFVFRCSAVGRVLAPGPCVSCRRGGPRMRKLAANDRGLLLGFDRSRSFLGDCTPSHPFVNTSSLRKRPGRTRRPRTDCSLRPSCVAEPASIRDTFCLSQSWTNLRPRSGWAQPAGIMDRRCPPAHDQCSLRSFPTSLSLLLVGFPARPCDLTGSNPRSSRPGCSS